MNDLPPSPFDDHYGLELDEATDELVRAHVVVRRELLQPVGQSNHTSFLRPMSEGTIHAVARRRHRGRTTWIWDVEMTDDEGRLCALSRVTIAVRER